MSHSAESRGPNPSYAVAPVLIAPKGLKITASGAIDTRYVDGALLAHRRIQEWYRGQLGVTFRMDPLKTYVSKRTLAEINVGSPNRMYIDSTLRILLEAYEEGVVNFSDPTRLFAVSSVGFFGIGGLCIGRNFGQLLPTSRYGELTPRTDLVIRFATGMSGVESAIIAGLDPEDEGLGTSGLVADTVTGGLAHEIGHAFGGGTFDQGGIRGLEHPDHACHGYPTDEYGSGGTVTYTANSMTDTSKAWSVNHWIGSAPYSDMQLRPVPPGSVYEARQIIGNTPTTITIAGTWAPGTPPAGTQYTAGRPVTIMGAGFRAFPDPALCKFYRGEKDHLLLNLPEWWV